MKIFSADEIEFDVGTDYEEDIITKKIGSDSFWFPEIELVDSEPEDNIGRETCFWCSFPTVRKPLFSTSFNYCEHCKK